ncbi:hypothetical protein CAP36_08400 [Chitinophagaceae bacterium IBVUCB2]|nr:hypothetical protein CAP36_08400 [Chitinophagaceae bacterium IBVUCB2]
MKKITTLAICLACTLIISSCTDSKTKAQTDEQKETGIEKRPASVITDKHVKIPNSSLYIIPPPGFAVDETSATLSETDGTAHFAQMNIISGYTKEKLFSDFKSEADKNFPGSWKEEPITVNGHTATIYRCKTAGYSQYFMSFTDGYADEMIIANYEEKDAATATAMYEALKTVLVKK